MGDERDRDGRDSIADRDAKSWKPWYRGRFSIGIEVVEDSRERAVYRVWVTKWDEVFKVLQSGGAGFAILGALGIALLIKISAPAALAAAGVLAVGGTSNFMASRAREALRRAAKKNKKSGTPFEIALESSGASTYRDSRMTEIHLSNRVISSQSIQWITLVDLPPHSDFRWSMLLHLEDELVEPFPPFLGQEEEILPVAEAIANRCGVELRVER